jgi:hypothetical protein
MARSKRSIAAAQLPRGNSAKQQKGAIFLGDRGGSHGPAGNALRQKRRSQHRLPGHGRRAARHRLCPGFRIQSRSRVGEPRSGSFFHAALFVLAADHIRQAWYRPVGPGGRNSVPRRAHGRCTRGNGCGRLGTGNTLRSLRRRANEPAVRRHLPRAGNLTRDLRLVCSPPRARCGEPVERAAGADQSRLGIGRVRAAIFYAEPGKRQSDPASAGTVRAAKRESRPPHWRF